MTPEEIAAQEAAAAAETARLAQEAGSEAEKARKAGENSDQPRTLEEALARLAKETTERQKANAEAQKHRGKLKEYETAEEKRKQAEMSELEKAQTAAKKAEEEVASARQEALDSRILVSAGKANFRDPEDALKLIDRADLTDTASIDKAIAVVLKGKPYLAGEKTEGTRKIPVTGGTNPGGGLQKVEEEAATSRAKGLFSVLNRPGRK